MENQITQLIEAPKRICFVCKKDATSFCAQCRTIHYCSRKCQLNDWPIHRLLCNKKLQKPEPNSHEPLLDLQTKQPELWSKFMSMAKQDMDQIYVISRGVIIPSKLEELSKYMDATNNEKISECYNSKSKDQVVLIIQYGEQNKSIFMTRMVLAQNEEKSKDNV
jgi:hypothetical protein